MIDPTTEPAFALGTGRSGWATRRAAVAHVVVGDLGSDDPASLLIDDEVEHHLRRVLRVRNGETVTLTDLAGQWRAAIARVSRDRVELSPNGPIEVEPVPPRTTRLAVAIPKGDRLDWMVQKTTEIGVDRLTLLHADHSTTRWTDDRAAVQLERLRRIAVEACRQSRRVWGVEIDGPVLAVDVVSEAVVAEPGGRPLGVNDSTIAIGPEGGWSPAELAVAGERVSLGPNILRVETAALAAATLSVAIQV
jgi:16S rRNA (uracil1498-N3)-methyltransferase